MALISIATRNQTQVELIDTPNLDLSGYFNVGNATYSALQIPTGGISYITGQITFKQTNDTINFDDRFNPIWNRGRQITITYRNPDNPTVDFTRYPVIGTTYITSSSYDFKSTLVLNVGCILALLNKLTPQDLGVCIEIGVGSSVSVAVKALIESAGVDASLIDDTSFDALLSLPQLVQPLTVEQGQSILDLASRLAGQHGTFFCQDNEGMIRCFLWNDFTNKAKLFSKSARDMHAYERSGSLDTRTKTIVLTHNDAIICTESPTQSQSTITGNQRTDVEITRDDVNRQMLRTTREFRRVSAASPFILVSKVVETSTYEPEPPESSGVVRVGQAEANGTCYPEDKGRLLSRITETRIDNTEYIESWDRWKASTGEVGASGTPSVFSKLGGLTDPDGDFLISGYNAIQNVTETWQYVSENEYVFTTQSDIPFAVAVPIWGDRKAGLSGADPRTPITESFDPNNTIPYEIDRIIYTRNDDACKGWKTTQEKFELTTTNDPDLIEAAKAYISGPVNILQQLYEKSQLLVATEIKTENNQSEPSPDTYPPERNVALDEVETIIGEALDAVSTNFPLDVVQRVFLGDYNTYPYAEIIKIGSSIMDYENGRILGIQMADSPFAMRRECWTDFLPVFLAKIIEPYSLAGGEVASIFAADSPSISISPTETVIGFQGVFLGQQTDPVIVNSPTNFDYVKSANQPPSGVQPQSVPSINLTASFKEDMV